MPASQRDNLLLAEVKNGPGWSALKDFVEERIEEQLTQVTVHQLFDQKSVGKHNVAIGKIQALREILNVVEASTA